MLLKNVIDCIIWKRILLTYHKYNILLNILNYQMNKKVNLKSGHLKKNCLTMIVLQYYFAGPREAAKKSLLLVVRPLRPYISFFLKIPEKGFWHFFSKKFCQIFAKYRIIECKNPNIFPLRKNPYFHIFCWAKKGEGGGGGNRFIPPHKVNNGAGAPRLCFLSLYFNSFFFSQYAFSFSVFLFFSFFFFSLFLLPLISVSFSITERSCRLLLAHYSCPFFSSLYSSILSLISF